MRRLILILWIRFRIIHFFIHVFAYEVGNLSLKLAFELSNLCTSFLSFFNPYSTSPNDLGGEKADGFSLSVFCSFWYMKLWGFLERPKQICLGITLHKYHNTF